MKNTGVDCRVKERYHLPLSLHNWKISSSAEYWVSENYANTNKLLIEHKLHIAFLFSRLLLTSSGFVIVSKIYVYDSELIYTDREMDNSSECPHGQLFWQSCCSYCQCPQANKILRLLILILNHRRWGCYQNNTVKWQLDVLPLPLRNKLKMSNTSENCVPVSVQLHFAASQTGQSGWLKQLYSWYSALFLRSWSILDV